MRNQIYGEMSWFLNKRFPWRNMSLNFEYDNLISEMVGLVLG